MKFPPNILDEIRARLPVSAVVGRRVRLKKQGREYAGLSPFNPEKTPSFFVNDHKGFYHCFSSGKHGDVFRFLMETEGLSFPEAVERLAAEAGVPLPKPDQREVVRERQRASLADVVELACQFFQETFRLSAGATARAYAERRGLRPETIREFRIGAAPAERDALKRHLIGRGVDERSMIDAGLLIEPDDGRPSYDRFRNRLIIPIQDERGRVVAFGGRALGPDDKPKYLNSPETELFHKGFMLFNGHRARAAAHESGQIVVVEGYLDAIAVVQAGIGSVVATLGTAFTEEQIQRMWRFAPEPVVCFDGDRAGISAAHRAIDRILPHLKSGFSFNFCFLPDGKDPDELIAGGGREAFLAEIQRAVPLAEVLWERETAGATIDTPERKAALEKRLNELTTQIQDRAVQQNYKNKYRIQLMNMFWRTDRQKKQETNDNIVLPKKTADDELPGVEAIILGICVEYPGVFFESLEHVISANFLVEQYNYFRMELFRVLVEFENVDVSKFYEKIDNKFHFVLRNVHGDSVLDKSGNIIKHRGHALRARLPIVGFLPSEEFIYRIFYNFLGRLQLRDLERHREEVISSAGNDIDSETEVRAMELIREVLRRREEYFHREQELAEEAKLIRAAFGADKDTGPVFAPVGGRK
ncbi:DNA primase [Prosthecodimorpha staleyi]|uniref:DNA primase n=1 Tax=Prosthecodimorpha staleyi TaxID=2840188 RepID=A0A947GIS5_9HYPH|nr:DNA primase [Prosthecodimorpha staleyi]MBT9290209.1 DNA primase [Prosthecodimorpha staleyi]